MQRQHEDQNSDNDYLWDHSGQPDPEIRTLELTLARFRHIRPASAFTRAVLHAKPPAFHSRGLFTLITSRLVATVFILVAIASGLWLSLPPGPQLPSQAAWQVQLTLPAEQLEGTSSSFPQESWLRIGQTLETGVGTKASVAVAEIGRLEVEPMSRLRLLRSSSGRQQIALDRGTIHATIWASPGQFVVDTPSAVVVDLGCMYTLHVDDNGRGTVRTTLGWVGFRRDAHESFIPAGAACSTRLTSGPGTPYFEDASDAFRSGLARFDSSAHDSPDARFALGTILAQARPRDALTLWHLLPNVGVTQRAAVYDRFAQLVPPPVGVTRDGILRLDRTMLDSWWNALDLGDISLYRHWERTWINTQSQPN
jgi:hypothetical protein